MNPEFETVIGLEVHAQLTTRSKMFCRCGSDYASAEPNTRTCPVCLGMPGVLPTINRQAVENTILTALALNCQVPERAKFDRKNYPYPDLVKGYQISQYDEPFGLGGWIEVETDGNSRRLGITRVHLEEDVCKLLHRGTGSNGYSLVDANRSGVPLMEIVSEPDMRSPAEARNYLIKLRSILRYLGVSLANMEEGSFRCDANISIRPKGSEELLAKVEVKNMNSLKAVYRALEFEAERQRKAFINGEKINQETRGWVEETGKTVSQRSKEYAHDYRYFPEPDLPPLEVSREWVENIRCRMPELPDQRCQRFIKDYSLSDYDAGILTASKEAADYFETVLSESGRSPKEVANWIAGPVSGIINAQGIDFEDFGKKVSPEEMTGLLKLEGSGSINMATAKTVLEEMFNTGKSAATLVNEKGLTQISGSEELDQFAVQVIEANPSAVADFKAGKEQALKFLIGQMMRLTRGRANPEIAADILKRKLEEY
ncbi:MAG: Asp-tRNA(Asn)/Glu-tRNA(Gln) amidotransferase subunit GatB [Dehalococcoidales bacterium]|jgi:aspartyl-tRNA(Asn)/glutamyl-tRNA(Gln) amidotransferase subunit B|nr:Asp-tRNA(Asn)/Glu-tRNA(Gln) amidotransferase subunit GatB [Dehalococcoidales bacterium]MDD4229869.1 Asp-tRNA(Asn)/Glu-tRNA(Gln) amidotransferase subunit GatB [Dehalococcoidales bacterium]MDD4465071.1 Asp-tRNA(Asn)/Glu-tRNA(Gln) amidotransferase subunit GatB [Dehalococcoidales bacterium]MDD5401912.1 Asp-tRNA(Asn)/Glu-tRNA(Gln) amidotransferase subunit GatB [Dehalococcoidales bacterium]